MAEIYPRWRAAHGISIVTPVYWYQVPSTLKLMIDRLVCADGGIPSDLHGGQRSGENQVWTKGWPYPQHLAGRVYGVVVHGDVAGIEPVRHALCDWLDWTGLIDAGPQSARPDGRLLRAVPLSHQALDEDTAFQEEVRNVARALARGIGERRAGRLKSPGADLASPRQSD